MAKKDPYNANLKIEYVPISSVKPYANNARVNDDAIPSLKASIKNFKFSNPISVDGDGVVIYGHSRLIAAKALGMATVPVIRRTDLTEKQVKAYRLADNKISEMSSWDFDKLDRELDAIASMDGDDALSLGELGFPEIDDDAFGGEDTAPAVAGATAPVGGGDAQPAAIGGASGDSGVAGTLPPELQGHDLRRVEQEKIDVEAKTNLERVIIVYPRERMHEVAAMLGLKAVEKVVYHFDELHS